MPAPAPDRGRRPACLALTGGIGSGKSTALAMFARLGAAVLSADEVVHRLYRDPEVVEAVRARFGNEVVGADGVDRGVLGARAFAQVGGMAFLEGLIHPRVRQARDAWVAEQLAVRPLPPLLVCEVPLLFEAGAEGDFDATLVVTASEGMRRERVEARGQDFAARAARQLAEEDKVQRSDRAFLNDGSLGDLEAWVAECFAAYATGAAA